MNEKTKEDYRSDAIMWLNAIDSTEALKMASDLCYRVFYLWKIRGKFQGEGVNV